jgi:hypothetical protein
MPFEGLFDNVVEGKYWTNKELWGFLNPQGDHLPYIYADITTFGGEEF